LLAVLFIGVTGNGNEQTIFLTSVQP